MTQYYAVYFSPVDDQIAKYQIIDESEIPSLTAAWAPPELPEWFQHMYVVDSETWLCIAPTLHQAQMNLFTRWVMCLNAHIEDGLDWFLIESKDPNKIMLEEVLHWVNIAKIQLFIDIKETDSLTDFLTD